MSGIDPNLLQGVEPFEPEDDGIDPALKQRPVEAYPGPDDIDLSLDRAANPVRTFTPALEVGARQNPDAFAKSLQHAAALGVPRETAAREPALSEAEINRRKWDPATLMKTSPVLASWISKFENAAVAHDDHEPLSALENLVGRWGPSSIMFGVPVGGPVIEGYPQRAFNAGMAGRNLAEIQNQAARLGVDPKTMPGYAETKAASQPPPKPEVTGILPGFGGGNLLTRLVGSTASILPGMATGTARGAAYGMMAEMAMGAGGATVGGPVGGLAGLVAGLPVAAGAFLYGVGADTYDQERGGAYDELVQRMQDDVAKGVPGARVDYEIAAKRAHVAAMINAAVEVGGNVVLMGLMPVLGTVGRKVLGKTLEQTAEQAATQEALALKAGPIKTFLKAAWRTLAGTAEESATEGIQRASTMAQVELGSAEAGGTADFSHMGPEVWDEVKGAAESMFLLSLLGAGGSFVTEIGQSRAAREGQARMQKLGEIVQASRTQRRLPEKTGEFAADLVKAGAAPENVYVPIEDFVTFWQESGHDAQEAAKQLGVETEFQEALTTRADLAIPFPTYVSRIAGNATLHKGMSQIAKFDPSDKTPKQADEMDAKLNERIELVANEMAEESTRAEKSNDQDLEARLTAQLVNTGMTIGDAQASGKPLVWLFRTLEQRLGVEAGSVASEYEVEIVRRDQAPSTGRGETVQGQTAFQGSPRSKLEDDIWKQKFRMTAERTMNEGSGQYLSSKKSVAEWYREALSNHEAPPVKFKGAEGVYDDLPRHAQVAANFLIRHKYDADRAKSALQGRIEAVATEIENDQQNLADAPKITPKVKAAVETKIKDNQNTLAVFEDALKAIESGDLTVGKAGNVFVAEIPEDDELLDWRKTKQSPKVRKKLEAMPEWKIIGPVTDKNLYGFPTFSYAGWTVEPDPFRAQQRQRDIELGEAFDRAEKAKTAARTAYRESGGTPTAAGLELKEDFARIDATLSLERSTILQEWSRWTEGIQIENDVPVYTEDQWESTRDHMLYEMRRPDGSLWRSGEDFESLAAEVEESVTGQDVYWELARWFEQGRAKDLPPRTMPRFYSPESMHQASDTLRDAGIPGHVYKSRAGNKNYVIYDESRMSLVETLYQEASNWIGWTPEKTSSGDYLGVPEWVNKPRSQKGRDAALGELVERMKTLTREGEPGRYWYEISAKAILDHFQGDVVETERFIQLVSIYSAGTAVFQNMQAAIKAYSHWKAGGAREDLKGGTGNNNKKAAAVLYDNDYAERGRKTIASFYPNLMHEIWTRATPEQRASLNLSAETAEALDKPATIDLWMLRAAGYDVEVASNDKGSGRYSFMENTVRRITAELNAELEPGMDVWHPHQVQAAIWSAAKAKHEGSAVQDAADTHFGAALASLSHIVTGEAIPSGKLGSAINTAPLEARLAFNNEMADLLRGPGGIDELGRIVGSPMISVAPLSGGYSTTSNPNLVVAITPVKEPGPIVPKAAANMVARAIQAAFQQDATPYFRAEFAGSRKVSAEGEVDRLKKKAERLAKKEASGKEIKDSERLTHEESEAVRTGEFHVGFNFTFKEPLTPEREQAFFNELMARTTSNIGYTLLNGGRTISVVNYNREDLADETLAAAAEGLKHEHQQELEGVGQFDAEGDYGPVHDWGADPEASQLLDSVPAGQRSLLQGWVRRWRDTHARILAEHEARLTPSPESVLYQGKKGKGKSNKQGYIRFTKGGRSFEIGLLDGSNLSTVLHETGHFFLEVMGDIALKPDAPQQIKDDYAAALTWLGVTSRDQIGTKEHEQWAKGFEAYLKEGKAPSVELASTFARFRNWLVSIYRAIPEYFRGINLSDDVRRVMDRLLATDDEIAKAQGRMAAAPMFESMDDGAMTLAQWEAYRDTANKATEDEKTRLQDQLLDEVFREREAWWAEESDKVRKDVTARVNADPGHRANAFLKAGIMLDGSEVPTDFVGRQMDRRGVQGLVGNTQEGLRIQRQIARAITPDNSHEPGLHPDVFAPLFGFKTGSEMIHAMVAAGSREKAIKEQTQKIMLERHGDLLVSGLAEAADKATHDSQFRERQYEMEYDALARKSASKNERTPTSILKQAAEATLARKLVRDVNPYSYLRAEAKANRAARGFARKGQFKEALLELQRAMFNHELFHASLKVKAEVEAKRKAIEKSDTQAATARLGKAGQNYVDQRDKLLEAHEFKRSLTLRESDSRQSMLDWIAEQEALGQHPEIPEKLAKELSRTSWKNLTVEELRGLHDSIQNIFHMAKLKTTLLTSEGRRDAAAARKELIEAAFENRKDRGKIPLDAERLSTKDKTVAWFADLDADLIRVEAMINWLDGNVTHDVVSVLGHKAQTVSSNIKGVWHRLIWDPMQRAKIKELDLMREVGDKFEKLTAALSAATVKGFQDDVDLGGFGQQRRQWLIAMVLNTGNAGNRQRLRDGGVDGSTLTDQEIDAMRAQLTQEEMDYVQGIWDILESLKPEAAALYTRRTGLPFPSVDAVAFTMQFPDGTQKAYRGGYYPLKYSRLQSVTGEQQIAETVAQMFESTYVSSSTSKGYSKDRVAELKGRPLDIRLAVLPGHIAQVIHDIAFGEAVASVGKILLDPQIRDTMQRTLRPEKAQVFLAWLKGVANYQAYTNVDAMTGFDKTFEKLRSNTTAAVLAAKMTIAVGNFGNLATALRFVRPNYMAKGLLMTLRNPLAAWREVIAMDGEMRHRVKLFDRDINEDLAKLSGRVDLRANAMRFGYALTASTDVATSVPIWYGAYEQAKADGLGHDDAVKFAGSIIRQVVGSSHPVDLPKVMRTRGATRAATMFFGYISAQYASMRSSLNDIQKARLDNAVRRRLPFILAQATALIISNAILNEYLSGRGPDDDDDIAKWWMRKFVLWPFQMYPYLRDAMRLVDNALDEDGGRGNYSYSPLAGTFEKAGKALAGIVEVYQGDKEASEEVFDLVESGALLLGVPGSAQIKISGTYIWDILAGTAEPESFTEFLHDLAYTRPKERR